MSAQHTGIYESGGIPFSIHAVKLNKPALRWFCFRPAMYCFKQKNARKGEAQMPFPAYNTTSARDSLMHMVDILLSYIFPTNPNACFTATHTSKGFLMMHILIDKPTFFTQVHLHAKNTFSLFVPLYGNTNANFNAGNITSRGTPIARSSSSKTLMLFCLA